MKEGIAVAIFEHLHCNFRFGMHLLTRNIFFSGHFCPAISKAVKTMKKNEKALLTVKPQCEFILM